MRNVIADQKYRGLFAYREAARAIQRKTRKNI
jgi:hypothetical protein